MGPFAGLYDVQQRVVQLMAGTRVSGQRLAVGGGGGVGAHERVDRGPDRLTVADGGAGALGEGWEVSGQMALTGRSAGAVRGRLRRRAGPPGLRAELGWAADAADGESDLVAGQMGLTGRAS